MRIARTVTLHGIGQAGSSGAIISTDLLYSQGRAGVPTTASYAYDGRNRLIVAVQTQAQRESTSRYHYAGGQRVLAQEGIDSQQDLSSYTRQARYQPASHRWLGEQAGQASPDASTSTTRYNANGQPNQIGQREYVWDALGQLLQVRQENTTLPSYTYSHRGERIGKTVQGHSTHYLYNEAGQISAELGEQGQLTRQYVYLADQPIAVIDTLDGK